MSLGRASRKAGSQAKAMLSGFKGANDETLSDWVFLPLDINTLLRNDLAKLRARSRDLARNDDTCRRFLSILKQNVLGHTGIKLQAKNKLSDGQPDLAWNDAIEREWKKFGRKRRRGGAFESPSTCGQFSLREFSWLSLWNRAIDGESFIHIMPGYPHNQHRFAMRFLNPDLLDSSCCMEHSNGNRVEMGIEFDQFERPVAYHFDLESAKKYARGARERVRIPASQIIHIFRREYVGQIRGIPDFAAIMHKAKMLNGVHEAIVVGWRVAASKMGFFTPKEDFSAEPYDTGERNEVGDSVFDASPGSFEVMQHGYELQTFDAAYPNSTYESGNKVFMQQMANGLNVSSPTLSNDWSDVNYSSLRQALLEDREGWRCIQAELIDGFYQPLFDEWYNWTVGITGLIRVSASQRLQDPELSWQPRGWSAVDPLKEVKAQILAVNAGFRTRQSVISETSGDDFTETAKTLGGETKALEGEGLPAYVALDGALSDDDDGEDDSSNKSKENDDE